MSLKGLLFSTVLSVGMLPTVAAQNTVPTKLSGTVIGTEQCIDYQTNSRSTTVNTCRDAFDGDLSTFFASWNQSYTWAGLDLGSPHVISRVGWAPASLDLQDGEEVRMALGVFEGANRPDFMDALPLYMIVEPGQAGELHYADVNCSKGFRYVRYIGPTESRCNVSELEFYGVPGEGDESELYRITNLPTVSVHTQDGVIPYDKEHDIVCQIAIISDKGKELLSEPGGIRQRGHGSNTFPKHPFRIKFDKKQQVLDAPATAKKWTLINNYSDKTLMRNMIAFELSRSMNMPYTSYIQPVDLLLNGEYQGCYQLCDQIEVRENRVDIAEMTVDDNRGTSVSGGYLIEIDARAIIEPKWFESPMGNPVNIHYPDEEEITDRQYEYIKAYFSMMEAGWERYLDLNTFLRHFLVGELSGNTDTYYSTYMYKQRGDDKLYTGPVWDFDLSFENDSRTYPINSKRDYVYQSGGSVCGNMKIFVNNIVRDSQSAKARLLEIWAEVRQGNVNWRHLKAFIDEKEQYLQQSQELNFMRWPTMFEVVQFNPQVWGGYAAEVENVRNYLENRLLWMDNKLGYTYVDGISSHTIDFAQPYKVYNLSGQACGDNMGSLPKGVYVVRQGDGSRKVQIP